MTKAIGAVAIALVLGTFLGAHFFAVPLRSFSVDSQGNQHCSGLRRGESFEVFCLSTERPWGESAGRNMDRTFNSRGRHPAAEDYRVPWPVRRPPQQLNPQGTPYQP